ncbi:copper-binding protein [Dickeya lacustris]|uniref:Copper-binding protein n=1 Tax=Dickeya lacustris TaxID=2259638 RepID=A0ABY8G6A6_9GAMM|nr:copper-binding protein [Dickeya lacustris]WFN55490.1 copper-binding protein [Dickeya lacustris]
MLKLSVAIATLLFSVSPFTFASTQPHNTGMSHTMAMDNMGMVNMGMVNMGMVNMDNMPHTRTQGAQHPDITSPDTPSDNATRYDANGTVKQWDSSTVTLSHEAITALRWPAMTMRFRLPENRQLTVLPPGSAVRFSFVQRADGYTLIDISPRQN